MPPVQGAQVKPPGALVQPPLFGEQAAPAPVAAHSSMSTHTRPSPAKPEGQSPALGDARREWRVCVCVCV